MILKFILKNLFLMAAIALAINVFLNASKHLFMHPGSHQAGQIQEEEHAGLLEETEMLN